MEKGSLWTTIERRHSLLLNCNQGDRGSTEHELLAAGSMAVKDCEPLRWKTLKME